MSKHSTASPDAHGDGLYEGEDYSNLSIDQVNSLLGQFAAEDRDIFESESLEIIEITRSIRPF